MMYVAIYYAAGLVIALLSAIYMWCYYGLVKKINEDDISKIVDDTCSDYLMRASVVYQNLNGKLIRFLFSTIHIMIFPINILMLFGWIMANLDRYSHSKESS